MRERERERDSAEKESKRDRQRQTERERERERERENEIERRVNVLLCGLQAWQTSKEPGPIRPKRNLRREPNLNILVADRLPYMACSY